MPLPTFGGSFKVARLASKLAFSMGLAISGQQQYTFVTGTASSPTPPPSDSFLLLESGDFLLLEDGSKLILE